MENITYEELEVISDCILFRINKMLKNYDVFTCDLKMLESISDSVSKLRKLNDKVCSVMKQEEKKKLSKLDLLQRNRK